MHSLSYAQTITLIFLSVLIHGTYTLVDYSDLEAMGISCPERDSCVGYRNNLNYTDRNCECDRECVHYGDCCVDFDRRRALGRSIVPIDNMCLNYGADEHTGVYVVGRCSSYWNGPLEVQQGCEGPPDFSDPMKAAPVTYVDQNLTYKNFFCAECNNANIQTLTTFHFKLACEGLDDLTPEQIMGDLQYVEHLASWGVNRLNDNGSTTFVPCEIIFDVPQYIYGNVRFCRANLVSRCARNWTRPVVRNRCQQYMAVVYDSTKAYKNPHCAICNHRTVADIACMTSLTSRKRPITFAHLLDVNQSEGDRVGMQEVATPECPSGQKYDPFFKKCRKLVCALPGYKIVNGRCAPGGQ